MVRALFIYCFEVALREPQRMMRSRLMKTEKALVAGDPCVPFLHLLIAILHPCCVHLVNLQPLVCFRTTVYSCWVFSPFIKKFGIRFLIKWTKNCLLFAFSKRALVLIKIRISITHPLLTF